MSQEVAPLSPVRENNYPNPVKSQGPTQEAALKSINPLTLPGEPLNATLPQTLSSVDDKLKRNFRKALREKGIDPSTFPTLNSTPPSEPLQLQIMSRAEKGKRDEMEDTHFHSKIPQGFLMGLFDGHGEKGSLANEASQTFQKHFPTRLQQEPPNIEKIFKEICASIHAKITKSSGGTTALVCYFDKTSHRLYTSNLGDSEAYLFRKNGDIIQGYPVSIKRDWSSPKDVERARIAYNNPEIFNTWSQKPPKARYFPFSTIGVNVSRSLGDKCMKIGERTAISQNPHVTEVELKKDDLVVMGCDGLWDFTTAQNLIDKVISPDWDSPLLASAIVNYALTTSSDNVTVICARVKTSSVAEDSNSLDSTQSYEDSDE